MKVVETIQHMVPDVTPSNVEVIVYPDGTWDISKWDLSVTQPSKEEIEAYWESNKEEIMSLNQTQKSEFEILKETVDQLVLDNLMRGQ